MIKLEDVWKVYPDGTEAVKGLSMEILDGELCILVGPSGCGKTTSMRLINRLLALTRGKIYVNGEDITKLDANELRRGIGYAIQEIGLFPHMTVGENITTVPRLLGWPKEKSRSRAVELLELVGLEPPDDFYGRYPAELSGGQRQRVGVARCLGADPPILLMDEPFGAIDPINRERLQNEFLHIQQEIHKTVVFVTHDINEAIKMGDRIALMNYGELVQYDTPAALLSQPVNSFVRGFVGTDRALKGLRLMRVKEVMRKKPPLVKLKDSADEARGVMDRERRDWAVVVDDDHKLAGWVNRHQLEEGRTVDEIKTPYSTTASPDTVLNEALSLMLMTAIGNLGIVDDQGILQGVLTLNSIRRVIGVQYTEEEEYTEEDAAEEGTGGETT
ncbi:MAG: betaine/proline/choline family ABC transporter ATP-binding protein [Candidatus Bipolaricaulota bacterium]